MTLHHAAAHLAHHIATTDLGNWTVTRQTFIHIGRSAYMLRPELAARWWHALEGIGATPRGILNFGDKATPLRLIRAAERAQPTPQLVQQTIRAVLERAGLSER